MAEQKTKRYMEIQMEELKAAHATEEDSAPKKKSSRNNSKNAELASMYEDAAEYEEDLKCFEDELEIVKSNELQNIATELTQKLPDEDRDYVQELKAVLESGWTYGVEVEKTRSQDHLEIIKEVDFCDAVEKLSSAYPDYSGDFETDVRDILVKRWEGLIAIKKEHINQELEEIKIAGLKPKYVKRVYEQFHGLC